MRTAPAIVITTRHGVRQSEKGIVDLGALIPHSQPSRAGGDPRACYEHPQHPNKHPSARPSEVLQGAIMQLQLTAVWQGP